MGNDEQTRNVFSKDQHLKLQQLLTRQLLAEQNQFASSDADNNVDGDGEPVREDDYKFVVADVNHVLQGNAYWATARDYAPGLRGILNALG